MKQSEDRARAATGGDANALATQLLKPERDNLVERPWGGPSIRRFKRLEDRGGDPRTYGEAFEISAFSGDTEASRFPSRLRLDDGSMVELPALLERHGDTLLGAAFIERHGACFPLLPKTLAVKELLSVQGHPEGNTEVYIVIAAEPGATLRLGFRRDIDAGAFGRELHAGIARQQDLLELLAEPVDLTWLQDQVAPWLARRSALAGEIGAALAPRLGTGADRSAAEALLAELKTGYWQALDAMNAIEVEAGQVIYNATPERLLATSGRAPSAEVHALGNPERREILALEIRRPGPTFRAWDNVRFPRREVDVDAALAALNLRATAPDEFIRERQAIPGRPGASVSVDCEFFRVEHLAPEAGRAVAVPAGGPHALHCLAGAVEVRAASGRLAGTLESGESALVPIGVGAYAVATAAAADVVRVSLPEA